MSDLHQRQPSGPTDYETIVGNACRANDIPALAYAIQEAGSTSASILPSGLAVAVMAGHIDVVRYLLKEHQVPITRISPTFAAQNPSVELLQLLLDNGFDLNKPSRSQHYPGPYLLQQVCHDELLVHWCLEHGARVDGMLEDTYTSPPLLQSVANLGTVATFKLLLAKSAKLEGRILHFAAQDVGSYGPDKVQTRMEMLRYLVDELGLDVNAMDSEEPKGNFFGVPLKYAAKDERDCTEGVKFLLERGADVSKCTNASGVPDALSYARHANNVEIVKVLQEWESKQRKESV